MVNEKLSSDEVPKKFTDWLLTMGCPPEKVPSIEKVSQLCKGQYHMVWRSVMEHVQPKDIINEKRRQVFCDDIRRYKKDSPFNEHNLNLLTSVELKLWHQHIETKKELTDSELRISQARDQLQYIMKKVSNKMSQRNLSRARLDEVQRRSWLLQQLREQLRERRDCLIEARAIADSLCRIDNEEDVKSNLDKCMSIIRQQKSNPSASQHSGITASYNIDNNDTAEEQLSALSRCNGDAVWRLIHERRSALTAALAAADQRPSSDMHAGQHTTSRVLSNTAGLHCKLGLEAMKNRLNAKSILKRIESAILNNNNELTVDSCELRILECECAEYEARLATLRSVIDQLSSRSGIFQLEDDNIKDRDYTRDITAIDKDIENKKNEIKRLASSLAVTEIKIKNVKDCLTNAFKNFHKQQPFNEERFGGDQLDMPQDYIGDPLQFYEQRNDQRKRNMDCSFALDSSRISYKEPNGVQLDLPQESIADLLQFYEQRNNQCKRNMDCSFELDSSRISYKEPTDYNNVTFVQELEFYLKKFHLEKNRKLVLDSGAKFWIFETLQHSLQRLYIACQGSDISCSLVCPSASLSANLRRLIDDVHWAEVLKNLALTKETRSVSPTINIKTYKEAEDQVTDKIKKCLHDNLLKLQKTNKILDVNEEDLKLWSDNQLKKYINCNRTVNRKSYKEYETDHLE